MKENDFVGGKWWKFDFHIHTPASDDYGHNNPAQKNITPTEFLIHCMKKELDCIAITDHNVFDWIPQLNSALSELRNSKFDNFREITIFPGVEINAQGGVHLLCIFDQSEKIENLKSIMVKIEYDYDNQTTKKSLHEVIKIIVDNNGIAIPAHVDTTKGLFNASADIKRTVFYNVQGLLALEMINPNAHDGEYFDSKLKLARILGSDSHSVETIADKFTWIKMGKPNLEALRLALYDVDGAVCRSDQFNENFNLNNIHSRTYIKSLKIKNGRYIGKEKLPAYEIQFNPFLNTLIGGRGTGKSTIINFLRLILNRECELPEELVEEFKNFSIIHQKRDDVGMLESDTEVEVIMFVDGVEYKLQWNNNDISEFDYETLRYIPINDKDILKERFPINIFSQKQLYEMTKDTSSLFSYIDSYWDVKSWYLRLAQTQVRFKELLQRLKRLHHQCQEYNRLKQSLKDVISKLKIFESDTIKKVLEDNAITDKQLALVQNIYDNYQYFIDTVDTIKSLTFSEMLEDASLLDYSTSDKLKKWEQQFSVFQNEFKLLIQKYPAISMSIDDFLETIGIKKRCLDNEAKMKIVIQNLKNAGVDNVDRYEELIYEQKQLQEKLQQYKGLDSTIETTRQELKETFNLINQLIEERYSQRSKIIESFNSQCKDFIRLRLKLFGNLNKNNETFRNIIGKTSGFDSDIFEDDKDLALEKTIIGRIALNTVNDTIKSRINKLVEEKKNIIQRKAKYSTKFIGHLEKIFSKNPDIESELYVWIPEDNLELEIKVDNQFKSVDMGSRGQRSSAMLALILNTSNVPIIIDQPEDDLDTKNITEMVVKSLNKIKNNVQIILATHNPNIVVNANAEWIVNLDFKNGQIVSANCGALQEHSIRDAICEVMEGGKEALEKRYYSLFKALNRS